MPDKTTTSEPEVQVEETPELETQETQTEAGNQGEETSQTSESAETVPEESKDESENTEETEIKEWAAKKNLPLDDPIKIAKMYRESEKALGKKGQQEGQLKNAVTDANASSGADDIQSVRNEVAALSFYIQHPEAGPGTPLEAQMVTILEDKPHLASDLELVLDAAKGKSTTEAEKLVAERQAGKKEALASVAQAERAAPPRASASTRETPGQVSDEDIGKMTPSEYAEYRKTNNPFKVS